MFFFHWTMILVLPPLALAIWAQARVKSTYAHYAKIGSQSGFTGAQVAARILRDENIELVSDPSAAPPGSAVGLAAVHGHLTDHYDPRTRMLHLSDDIYNGHSIAALGISAHEVGHAIQHARLYSPLMMRNFVYPVCSIGSGLAWPLFLIGFFLSIKPLLTLGILFFSLAVLFSVITLPVEFNASSRALRALSGGGYLTDDELRGARKVLNAAALTYVAASAVAIMTLVRMVIMSRD